MSDDADGGVDGGIDRGADTGTAHPWDLSGDAAEPVEAEMVGSGWDADEYADEYVDTEPERTDGGAIAALVLAIASYVLLPLIGSVVALFLAAGAEQRISVSGGALGGSGLVTAAKVLAWVNLALLAVAALAVLVVLLVRSADVPLDLDKAEETMTENLQGNNPGVSVERVTCPNDVVVEKGGQFTCSTVIDGQDLEITVTQTDDQGKVDFSFSDAVVPVDDIESFLVEEYRKQGTRAVAFCAEEGQQVLVTPKGSTIECLVQIPDGDGTTAVVTVKEDGSLTIDFGAQAEEPAEG
ncbi:MAG: DUF4333 domain-containing protein [Acidimicrobiia bacterium]